MNDLDDATGQMLKNAMVLTAILAWLHGKGLYEECEKDLGLKAMMGIEK